MSFYGKTFTVNGLGCGISRRGRKNGEYQLVFEREFASLEQIEAIDWSRIEVRSVRGECLLPEGYGFELRDISYRHSDKSYTVTLGVAEQYLGDVTGYQAQVAELQAQVTELTESAEILAELEAAYDEN